MAGGMASGRAGAAGAKFSARCACTAIVATLLGWGPAPAGATFACYDWPSVQNPDLSVQVLVSDACADDLQALSNADGFEHLAEDVNGTECSNAQGFLYFGPALCNQTLESLTTTFPDRSSLNGVVCDSGYLTLPAGGGCPAFADLLNRLASKDRDIPTFGQPEHAPDHDEIAQLFENRSVAWFATFGAIALATLLIVVIVGVFTARAFRRFSAERKAGGFQPSRRQQVKVKQGVYSGVDELGFTANEITVMKSSDAVLGSARKPHAFARGGAAITPPPMALASVASTPGSNVRYHHPDWCATGSPASSVPLDSTVEIASSPSSTASTPRVKKVLKVTSRKRLVSQSPNESGAGYESDQSLLLY